MTFFRPTNLTELAACLAQKPEDCHLVAGCTDFLAKRNGQAWEAEALLSLSDVAEMKSITLDGDKLSIGAACTHSQIEANELVKQYFPALAAACGDVGSRQIRNRGTIGGNVGNASPAGDTFPVLLCLGAQAVLFNGKGETRKLPMDQLVLGIETTALAGDEVILSFDLPLPAADAMAALEGKPLSRDLFPALAQALSGEIRRSIPTRASMPYKHRAVAGLADTVLDILTAQAEAKSLL